MRCARALVCVAVIVHFVAVVGAALALFVWGEHTRATFFLLYGPRHPFAAAGIVLLPAVLFTRAARIETRRVLVVMEVVAMLIALFPLMELRVGRSSKPRGTPLRLLTYNVFYARTDRAALTREITGAGANVIVLQEARSSFGEYLQAQLPGWTVRVDDEFLLATKLNVREIEKPKAFADASRGWVRYSLEGAAGALEVVNVHPISPRAGLMEQVDPRIAIELRGRQIESAAAAASRARGPVIIAGDTNLPPLSAVGRRHLSPYRDAFEDVGLGFGYTFPAKLPWMRIDRVLSGPGVRFLDVRVLPRGASDHRAVVADFELEPH